MAPSTGPDGTVAARLHRPQPAQHMVQHVPRRRAVRVRRDVLLELAPSAPPAGRALARPAPPIPPPAPGTSRAASHASRCAGGPASRAPRGRRREIPGICMRSIHRILRVRPVLAATLPDRTTARYASDMTQPWRPSERYPDPAVECWTPASRPTASALPRSSACIPAAAGPRGPSGSGTPAACSGATSPTTASCAGTRRPARPPSSASRPTTPTATPATARAAWSPASTAPAGSPAPSMTAPSPCWPTVLTASASTRPTTSSCKSDGSIWFTDPDFGILGYYEGEKAERELPTNVYRIDGQTGAITMAADEVGRPNGLAFSPDERILYIVECAVLPRRIQAYDVAADGAVPRQWPHLHRCRPRYAGRLPRRCRRQSVVWLGHEATGWTGC